MDTISEINISKMDKAEVLVALYSAAKPQGLGFLHFDPTPMSKNEAPSLLDSYPGMYFDYLKGRVMKVKLSGDVLETWLYDRDNGHNAAWHALKDAGLISE